MPGDWIKLHRKILSSAVMRHDGLCRLWVYCLLRANWEDRSVLLPRTTKQVHLKRGQFITGRRALHASMYPIRDEEGNLIAHDNPPPDPSTLWRWLKNLEAAGQLKIDSAPAYSVVTICNYNTYQDDVRPDAPESHQSRTNHAPDMHQPCAQNKKERIKEGGDAEPTPTEEKDPLIAEWEGRYTGPNLKPGELAGIVEELRGAGKTDADIRAAFIHRPKRTLPRKVAEAITAPVNHNHVADIERQMLERRKEFERQN